MSQTPALSVINLTKVFGDKKVLKSLDLTLDPGDIYALIGPNGSGKTTLIKNIVGLQKPDVGTINIAGYNLVEEPILAKSLFGYVPDNPTGFEYLTGREFLHFCGSLKNVPPKTLESQVKKLIPLFPLKDILDLPQKTYSRGNLQKVAFLGSLLGDPKLLLIDEPIAGLDPTSAEIFGLSLKKLSRFGVAILFVTHVLEFAQKYATRYGLLKDGRLVSSGNLTASTHLENLYKRLNDNA